MAAITNRLKRLAHWLLAWGAYWYYGRPSRRLIVIGVTGTKGKSTVCRLIASVLEASGARVGLLSTVEFQIADRRVRNERKMTMLGRGEVHKLLRAMAAAGCRYAVVETSSEGILQYRHLGLNYDLAVFTNLGTEHSERHGGAANLKRDKGQMFAALSHHPPKRIAGRTVATAIIANLNDAAAPYYLNFLAVNHWGFSLAGEQKFFALADDAKLVEAAIINAAPTATNFRVAGREFKLSLPGIFNVRNALPAIAVGRQFGIPDSVIQQGLAAVTAIPGRLEFVNLGQDFSVVVDYAHEPLSYQALFTTLRSMLSPGGRLIAVIGADGGGRDIAKRKIMGTIAGQQCDALVVSDVNSFNDDPREIAEMLAAGAREAGKRDGLDLFVIVERRAGIRQAIALARPGDIVVLTAKGSEPCICVAGGRQIPWSDRQAAEELIRERLAGAG
ncbi:MAG: UDP-N-acetylmuramyl-tripeptide synthetase [Candidatus Magasanikbacteria bacterium]|nr:UDP-N-acetylmuramyl-tripeptide synthetase [Candidatus Magasanikbacteria bacterium]